MKNLALLLVAAFVLSTFVAPAMAAGKTHEMTMVVVSVDAKTKMITMKDEEGESHTAPLMGAAIDAIKILNVKAGDKVTVTCQDDEKGGHQGVIAIKPVAHVKPAK